MSVAPPELCQTEQCAALILWNWGHEMRNKTQAILDKIEGIETQLSHTSLLTSTEIQDDLDKIKEFTQNLVELPSPFLLEDISLKMLQMVLTNIAEQKQPKITINAQSISNATHFLVKANSVWLGRLFHILIQNALDAIEYSINPIVCLELTVQDQVVRIAVRDTGPGIDEATQTIIFTPRFRPNGRGRGLYIARMIVDIYGGYINVEQSDQSGTTMVVLLPLVT